MIARIEAINGSPPLPGSEWERDDAVGIYRIVSCAAGSFIVTAPYRQQACLPCEAGSYCPGGAAPAAVQDRRRGMAAVLLTIFREEGMAGLYRGFATQIFTAVSKSGVLLTGKEQLAAFALGLVLMLRRRHARPRPALRLR